MKKFTAEDYEKLVELGSKFMPLSMCGSRFNLTANEFIDAYQADRKAQIAYEGGKASKFEEKLDKLAESDDVKAIQYFFSIADTKEELKKSVNVNAIEKKVTKKTSGLEHLTNPSLLKGKINKGVGDE